MAKQERRTIKATFSLGVDLVARLDAKATLLNQSRNALATAALEEAVRGLVLFDRARKYDHGKKDDRPVEAIAVNPEGENEAA